jgi:DNA repair protein RadC
MKDLSPGDRPREKLVRHGPPALGDNELVALVVGSGRARSGALTIANEVLRARGGLHGLARSTAGDLAQVAGIGPAKAARLTAALELGRRTLSHAPGARVRLSSPRDAAVYLMPAFGSRPVEQFGVVLLDSKHRVIRTSIVAVGTLNATVVQPRDDPSGDPSPSPDDVDLTRRLAAAGALMGIEVVDHLVLGDARYCSLKELGHM